MKFSWYIITSLVGVFFFNLINAQSDGCSNATPLTPSSSCTPVSGTTVGATQTIPGCVGTADDDVWYSFVATATSHQIDVVGASGFDAVVQLFSGSCSSLVSLGCQDNTLAGGTETIYATGLTIGATYTIRVYDYYTGTPGNFTICVHDSPPQPSNDFCSNAIPLAVNTTCSYTAGTSLGASETMVGCAGTADDDVWFSFVATNSVQTITVDPSTNMDAVVQLVDGVCVNFTSLNCEDSGFTNDNEVINAVGLVPGQTYYVRVYDYYSGNGGFPFNICITGDATAAPSNDEPCNAIQIPPVTAECSYLNFTTTGATATDPTGTTTPLPSSCVGGSGAMMGGYSSTSADVWFAITVPANGNIFINPEPNYGISDGVMALYSGSCGSLTQIACSDDNDYPGTANDLKPYINATGLTPGSTVYLRYWGYGSNQGDFGICVSSPTNDDCANALYICDINGYSASTSAAYTPDRPGTGSGQMYGNGETSTGVFMGNLNTTHTGGPFGYPNGSSPSGYYNVTIDNNSWITFTAAATTATLTVTIYDCWVGNYPSGGIQMQVFSGSNCDNFVSVSNFEESSTGFTITATGLTIGQDYYLMVDGYAGDICSYTISADSGVQFPDITATNNPICAGANTTLTAPAGATSYLWYPGGQTTQSITVTPSATTTYSCVVGGVCGYKQTLSKTITVDQLPTLTSATTGTICSGNNVNMTLISDINSTYTWSANSNSNVSGESTTSQLGSTINDVLSTSLTSAQTVIYNVIPTGVSSGCVGNTQTVTVTVDPTPTMTSSASQTICSGSSVNIPLTSNISSNYSWVAANNANTTGESTSVQTSSTINDAITNSTSTAQTVNYTVTPTSTSGGCTGGAQSVSVTVNPAPTMTSSSSATICSGNAVNLSLTSNISSSYNWSATSNSSVGGESTSTQTTSTIGDVLTNATSSVQNVTYNVTPTSTSGSCTGSSQTVTVAVNPLPTMTSTNSQTICTGSSVNIPLTSNISSNYSWVATSNSNVGGESTTAQTSSTINDALTNTTSSAQTVTYIVTPTSVSGSCAGNSQSVAVTVNPLDDASFNYAGGNTYCLTGTNPTATITGLGGGVFSISGGATINSTDGTIDLAGSGVGTYTVTYTTSGNCPSSSTTTINITTAPDATFSYANSAYCATGTASVNFGAGASAGTFSVSPSGLTINSTDGTLDLANSSSGSYTVTNYIAPAGGCAAATANTTVTVNPLPNVVANSTNTTICSGQQITLTGSGATSYTWDNGVTDGIAFSPSASTTYTVTGTDVNNCQNTDQIAITVNTLPNVTATASSSGLCDGQSVTLNGGGATSYTWDNGVSDGVAFTPSVGTVTYTVTGTDVNTCQNTAQVTVTVNSLPSVSINASGTTVCDGQSVTLNGSGAISYTWDNGVSDGVAFTPSVGSVTYNVIGTDGNNCSNAASVNVTVNPLDDASFNYSTTTYCATGTNPTPTITGLTGGTFSITGGATINSLDGTIDLAASGVGTYDVTYTTNGTCPNTQTVSINVTTAPDATFSYSQASYCQVGADVPSYPVGSSGGAFSTSPSGLNVDPVSGNIDLSTSAAGTYTITNYIAPSGGCAPATATTTLEVLPPDDDGFTYNGTSFCTSDGNQTPTISTQGGTFTSTGGLVFADGSPSSSGEIDFTNTPVGIYDITYTTNGTCVNDSTISITISSQLDATLSVASDSLCADANAVLITPVDNGGTWSGNGVDSNGNFDPAVAGVGTQQIIYSISGSCGDADTLYMVVKPVPQVSVVGDTVCDGSNALLIASGNGGTINWYSDPTLTTLVASDTNEYSPSGVGIETYYVQEILNGCVGNIDSANANVFDLSAGFTATPTSGNLPLVVDFTNTSAVVDTLNDQFYWTFGTGDSSNDFEPSYTYDVPGTFNATLIVTNAEGMCVDTAQITIEVNGEFTIEIPNIFTPNGDDVNDIFHINATNVKEVKAEIYDRWGLHMYGWEGINAGWDGRTKAGIPASEGTYFYFIEVIDLFGEEHKYEGPFNLNR